MTPAIKIIRCTDSANFGATILIAPGFSGSVFLRFEGRLWERNYPSRPIILTEIGARTIPAWIDRGIASLAKLQACSHGYSLVSALGNRNTLVIFAAEMATHAMLGMVDHAPDGTMIWMVRGLVDLTTLRRFRRAFVDVARRAAINEANFWHGLDVPDLRPADPDWPPLAPV